MSERERFEYWVSITQKIGIDLSRVDGETVYYDRSTQLAFEAWQAACPDGWQAVPKEPTEVESIIENSPLNDAAEVAIQSFLVDFNTHPNQEEFETTGVNGYFQWWRAKRQPHRSRGMYDTARAV